MRPGIDPEANDGQLVELSSGVDALYLSGRAALSDELRERLAEARATADEASAPAPFVLGGVEFLLRAGALGRYRYWLSHPHGQVGITPKDSLPAIRVQPRAEFLHGAGPAGVVAWFRTLLEAELGPVLLMVSRLDLYADFQGWALTGNDRVRFVCRAKDLATYEESEEFNGFQFGRRGSKTVSARIYDKGIESAKSGADYWKDVWGSSYAEGSTVLRVEFEIGREALREYGLDAPDDVLAAAGSLWSALTSTWLSYRVETPDGTKSRWPVAPEWRDVTRARIGDDAFGIERIYAGKRRGELRKLAPGLVGYLSNFAALVGTEDWDSTARRLTRFVRWYGSMTGRSFAERAAAKALAYALP